MTRFSGRDSIFPDDGVPPALKHHCSNTADMQAAVKVWDTALHHALLARLEVPGQVTIALAFSGTGEQCWP